MLMIQLPFADDHNAGGAKNKVKSVTDSICEWKLEAQNNQSICFKWPVTDSSFKPGDYVRQAKNDNSGNSGFGTSIVISRYGGKVIINFPVDSEGNVIVNILKKKDGC